MGIDPSLFEDPDVGDEEDYDEDGLMSIEAHAKALQPSAMDTKAVDGTSCSLSMHARQAFADLSNVCCLHVRLCSGHAVGLGAP
jgi:hypothetical protein